MTSLTSDQLCLTISPETLGFSDTSDLMREPLPWIGQERAEQAAAFGLALDQPSYNLFVLGEVGSGRSSLLQAAMRAEAAKRAAPPDLCYLHNFDAPERPVALRLPAGQGRVLRQLLAELCGMLQAEIPRRLESDEFRLESERIQKAYKEEESKVYLELAAFAEKRRFALHRESGRMVFTLLDDSGQPMTEDVVVTLPQERKAQIEQAELELHGEIARFTEKMRPRERAMNEALAALRRKIIKPVVEHEIQRVRSGMKQQIKDSVKLNAYLERLAEDVLDRLALFEAAAAGEDEAGREDLNRALARYRANLVVDNGGLEGAPVLVEDNPSFRALFGSIEYQVENDVLVTDFSRIRAGSLLQAHGGFLMLHLPDLVADPLVWEKLRRFLRSGRLQIEEPGTQYAPSAVVSLLPEAVDVEVKIVLIGSRDEYYELQEIDAEFVRHFRVKVDFAESFAATAETRRATAIFIAHASRRLGLPHFSSAAVARLLEEMHREADDQRRQSAIFAHLEALVAESAAVCTARLGARVEAADVEAALQARLWRHNYPDQRLHESIAEGELLISVHGGQAGRINGLTQVDLGDHRFGFPVCVSARTFPGKEGVLNIEREVEMSGPNHDKGVFILETYLIALFGHVAPLSLNASLVFEQEYHGVEGDSASCAELIALLSSLSGVPVKQGIAVTGAVNQHGDVLPVGGINEKIEGFFRVCEAAGLDGAQGVLVPRRNLRHLMLGRHVLAAVREGRFHVHAVEDVSEAIELATGVPAGVADEHGNYPHGSVLGAAQKTLHAYRRACHVAEHPPQKVGHRGRYSGG